jgi:hypothetical protein
LEEFTEKLYLRTLKIEEYWIVQQDLNIDLNVIGETDFVIEVSFIKLIIEYYDLI